MALEIKTMDGSSARAASAGQGALATTLGAIGVGLGVLNGGGLLNNGLLGGGNVTDSITAGAETLANVKSIVDSSFVNKDLFYQTLIGQINEQSSRDIAVERRFANVESALATNAAVGECNRAAIQREFEVVDNRFSEEARYDELALRYAMCGTIKGDLSIPFNKLSMGVADKTHVVDTYEARPFREPHDKHGCGHGHGGFSSCYGGF